MEGGTDRGTTVSQHLSLTNLIGLLRSCDLALAQVIWAWLGREREMEGGREGRREG